jgi:hypothetical protein
MPRLTYLAGVAVALVGGALALTDQVLSGLPGVTERNVRRIKPGMTRPEVEAILGGPASGYYVLGTGHAPTWYWAGPCGWAHVHLDRPGRVEWAAWVPANNRPTQLAEPLERLRFWSGPDEGWQAP